MEDKNISSTFPKPDQIADTILKMDEKEVNPSVGPDNKPLGNLEEKQKAATQNVINTLMKRFNIPNDPKTREALEKHYEKQFKFEEGQPFSEPISGESRRSLGIFKKQKSREEQAHVNNNPTNISRKSDLRPDRFLVEVGNQELEIPEGFGLRNHYVVNPMTGERKLDLESKPWTYEEVKKLYDYIQNSGKTIEEYAPLFQKWQIPSLEEAEKSEGLRLLDAENI